MDECQNNCKYKNECYKIGSYEDHSKMLSIFDYDFNWTVENYICYEVETPIRERKDNRYVNPRLKSSIVSFSHLPRFKHNDICNSFCQAVTHMECNELRESFKCLIFGNEY